MLGRPSLHGGLHTVLIEPIVSFYYIYQGYEQKNMSTKFVGLNPLTTGHAGRFPSGWGWFCSFQPPLGVFTQHNSENTHKFLTFNSPPPLHIAPNIEQSLLVKPPKLDIRALKQNISPKVPKKNSRSLFFKII